MNKDLLLREKLAIQRTYMANDSTFLAFLRTSMYFLVAGLSINNLLDIEKKQLVVTGMYVFSAILFVYGIVNYIRQRKKIETSKIHIGDYKLEYEKKE
jgi:putative membrane protein